MHILYTLETVYTKWYTRLGEKTQPCNDVGKAIEAIACHTICNGIGEPRELALLLLRTALQTVVKAELKSKKELCEKPLGAIRFKKDRIENALDRFRALLERLNTKYNGIGRFREDIEKIVDVLVTELSECETSEKLEELLENPIIDTPEKLREKIDILMALLEHGLVKIVITPSTITLTPIGNCRDEEVPIRQAVDMLAKCSSYIGSYSVAKTLEALQETVVKSEQRGGVQAEHGYLGQYPHPAVHAVTHRTLQTQRLRGIQIDFSCTTPTGGFCARIIEGKRVRRTVMDWNQFLVALGELLAKHGIPYDEKLLECMRREASAASEKGARFVALETLLDKCREAERG